MRSEELVESCIFEQTDIVKSNACDVLGDGIREVRSGGVIVYLTEPGCGVHERYGYMIFSLKGASFAQLMLGWQICTTVPMLEGKLHGPQSATTKSCQMAAGLKRHISISIIPDMALPSPSCIQARLSDLCGDGWEVLRIHFWF